MEVVVVVVVDALEEYVFALEAAFALSAVHLWCRVRRLTPQWPLVGEALH